MKEATTPLEPSAAAIAAESRATGKPANLPTFQPALAGIYGEQAAQFVNPNLGKELAHANELEMGAPLPPARWPDATQPAAPRPTPHRQHPGIPIPKREANGKRN